jgi:xanthine dehydrogenase YagR molybdenum-binding subunit
MDPIELRLRNEPDRIRPRTRRSPPGGSPTAYARAATRSAGHAETPPLDADGNQLVGIGAAAAVYHTTRSQCSALARINADGTADVQSGTSDMGPGTYTSMTQVAADALGLPIARVRFALGDSRFPEAPSHSGSRTMASVGSAVFTTANMLRDRFVRTAVVDPGSPLNGARPEEVSITDGRMFRTTAELARLRGDLLRRRGWKDLDTQQTWMPDDADQRFSMSAYGAVFAEVAVDELLGTVRIRRVYGSYDAGRIINPKLAHSQAIGGMVGGIGMALLEGTHLDYRDGRIVNANMSDYLVPVNADVPRSMRRSCPPRTPSPTPSASRDSVSW